MVLDEFAKSFLLWRTEVVTWVSRKPDHDGHALLLRPLRMVSIQEDHAKFGRQFPHIQIAFINSDGYTRC